MGLIRKVNVCRWRLRYWWLDTDSGAQARRWLAALALLVGVVEVVRLSLAALTPLAPGEPAHSFWWIVQIVIMIIAAYLAYANRPKTEAQKPAAGDAPTTADGQSVKHHFGTVWVEDEFLLAWKVTGTTAIRSKGGKK